MEEDKIKEIAEFVLTIVSIVCGVLSLVLSSIVNHYTKIEKADETEAEYVLKISKLKHLSGWNIAGTTVSLISLSISVGLFVNPFVYKLINS